MSVTRATTLTLSALLLVAAPAIAAPPPISEDCCDDPAANCCDPPDSASLAGVPVVILPPVIVPPPAPYIPPPIVAPLPPPVPARRAKRSDGDKFLFKLSLGAAYQLMLGESVGGAALEIQVGAEDDHWGGAAQLGIVTGQTLGGLTFIWLRFGPGFEFHLSPRVRMGFGLTVGALGIARAGGSFNGSDEMVSPSLGLHLDLSVDLVRGKRSSALFVGARLGGDILLDVTDLSPASLLLSASLGYRY